MRYAKNMKLLIYDEVNCVSGAWKCCYCWKSTGTQLPSKAPTSPEKCERYCCVVLRFEQIIKWTYIRDEARANGTCDGYPKAVPTRLPDGIPVSGPEFNYLE